MKTAIKLFLFTMLLFAAVGLWAGGDTEESAPEMSASSGVWGESPLLAARVASGDLPPVEDRIPSDPYVFQVDEIGTYGGTLNAFGVNNRSWNDLMDAPPRNAKMMLPDATGNIVAGETASAFEWANGGRSLIIHLREGMRWSDGDPVTTEDVIFARESMHREEAIGTWGAAVVHGTVENVTAIDDLTFRVDYFEA